jgi:ABC-type nitrate/sulfonate/bicarbonate transport system permease component
MVNAIIVTLVGLLAGAVLGIFLGLSVASHRHVLRGERPNTRN